MVSRGARMIVVSCRYVWLLGLAFQCNSSNKLVLIPHRQLENLRRVKPLYLTGNQGMCASSSGRKEEAELMDVDQEPSQVMLQDVSFILSHISRSFSGRTCWISDQGVCKGQVVESAKGRFYTMKKPRI